MRLRGIFALAVGVFLPSVAAAQEAPAAFSLEFDSCSSRLQQGPALFDGEGKPLEVSFPRPQVSVAVLPGIAVQNLTCGVNPGGRGALLSWDPPPEDHFEGVRIYRGGTVIRPLVLPSTRA